MGDTNSKKSQWKASFILSTPVAVMDVKSLKGIEFVIEDKDRKITGINVITPEMSHVSAVTYAGIICSRCVDYLSFSSGIPVTASLRQINEIGSKVAIRTGFVECSFNLIIAKRVDVDITIAAFQRVLQNEDIKLGLQLAHFRRGMLAKDVVEKIREFYQVLELEGAPAAETYRYVRHLVSHPELTKRKSVEEAIKIIGKPYFDPSAPRDLRNIARDASAIEKEARLIIQSRLNN